MVLFDEADGQSAVVVEVLDAADAAPHTSKAARAEVEEWLDAVALCFNLPEGRRWIDPKRLLRDS